MAKIAFIRTYDFYGTEWMDILYDSSNRMYTMPVEDMPKTAAKWMADKTPKLQYDKIHKREEVIYR